MFQVRTVLWLLNNGKEMQSERVTNMHWVSFSIVGLPACIHFNRLPAMAWYGRLSIPLTKYPHLQKELPNGIGALKQLSSGCWKKSLQDGSRTSLMHIRHCARCTRLLSKKRLLSLIAHFR